MYKKRKVPLSLLKDKSNKPLSAVGPGAGIVFFEKYFPKVKRTIRIATAYFTLTGYKLVKSLIAKDVKIQILVGREEGKNVQDTVLDEIDAEFGQCESDLWNTVHELIQKMKKGEFSIKDAREMQSAFHCKFYICDNKVMWHGSANFSRRGLKQSAEQVTASKKQEQIVQFTEWFDEVSLEAKDLLAVIIEKLEAWLQLTTPYNIYLKSLYSLNDIPEQHYHNGAFEPVYYQKGVIAQAHRQINEYGGAIIVAATGLGKTVMGAGVAHRLTIDFKVKKVILIAPHAVHENWERQLDGRDVNFRPFNSDLLFRKRGEKSYHKVNQLEKRLIEADNKTLVIIDEVHFVRNQLLKETLEPNTSLVFQRINAAINNGAKVLLLTATAYGTNMQNLNSLLYLLPPPPLLTPAVSSHKNLWQIKSANEFAHLLVVTVLGLPHVLQMAKNRGDIDKNGRIFIQFPGERRYLPKLLELYTIRYDLIMKKEIMDAFDNQFFQQSSRLPHHFFGDDSPNVKLGVTDTVYNNSLQGWLSSPRALKRMISKNLATPGKMDTSKKRSKGKRKEMSPYKAFMRLGKEERTRKLSTALNNLSHLEDVGDEKLLKLMKIIDTRCTVGAGKIIIYVNRYSTATYLEEKLQFYESIPIGCTVQKNKKGNSLKPIAQRLEILKNFSPRSHNFENEITDEINILICTDADSIGVNLQDANTIINYDPPEGADSLFQRVGRVLRMTQNPERSVHIYTFAPSIIDSENRESKTHKYICDLYKRISHRHDTSKSILGSSVFSHERVKTIYLDNEANVKELSRDSELLSTIENAASSGIIHHFSELEKKREQAKKLKDHLHSAKTYDYSQERVYVLFKYKNKITSIIFNIENQQIENKSEMETLDLIACKENEPTAVVDPALVEYHTNNAVKAWCKNQSLPVEEVKKICGLLLLPKPNKKGFKKLLDRSPSIFTVKNSQP